MRLGRLPLAGHFLAFHADSTGFLLRIAREQGDVAHFRLGRTDAFLLSHPDQVRSVLVDRAADFGKGRLMQRARRLLGDGLLTSEGAAHRRQRRLVQPVFARERRHAYTALVPDLATRHTASWCHGGRIRVDAEMDELAMKVVAGALLGADIEHEVPALGSALHRLARWAPLLAAPGGRVLERVWLPGVGSLGEALETIEAMIDRRAEAPHGGPGAAAVYGNGGQRDLASVSSDQPNRSKTTRGREPGIRKVTEKCRGVPEPFRHSARSAVVRQP